MHVSDLELICFNDNIQSDGFHPLNSTMTEWWYYCIQSPKGVFSGLFEINGCLKSRFFNKPEAIQSHYIYLPDREPFEFHQTYPVSDFSALTDSFSVEIGESCFKKEDEKYILRVCNDIFDLSITAENAVAGNPDTVSRYLADKNICGVHWRNPVLRSDCKGYFSFKHQDCVEFEGSFFHDHNWHNIHGRSSLKFIKKMKAWNWVILHDDKKDLNLLVVDVDYKSAPFKFTALKQNNSKLEVVAYDKNFSLKKNRDHYYVVFGDKELAISIKKEHFLTPYPDLGFFARRFFVDSAVQSHIIGPYTLFQNNRLISKGSAYVESFDLNGKK